jgi:hypothetical protein
MLNKTNFFKGTKGLFTQCKEPKRKPDYISKSGSKYWYGKNKKGSYVIRHSDHWVKIYTRDGEKRSDKKKISSCYWSIKIKKHNDIECRSMRCGKIYFKDLKFMHF